jgi:TolA-binding protein
MPVAARGRRATSVVVALVLGVSLFSGSAWAAISEPDRLWVVGTKAFEDALYDLAYRELSRFSLVAPTDPRRGDAVFLRAKAAFALGRHDDALAAFRAAETLPLRVATDGEAIFWQGETLFRLKRFDEARERYLLFVRAYPTSPYADDALYARGFAELELSRVDDAIASFQALLREQPQSELAGSAAYALGRELVRAKRWDEAFAVLSGYASRFPQSPFLTEARYLLGVTQMETGRPAEGIKTLEQFVAANPTSDLVPASRILLAETHLREGRAREALEEYQAFVKRAPTHPFVPQALYQVGELSRRLGRQAEAEATWRTLRRDFPRDALASLAGLELAQGFLRRRQFAQAMDIAREVADDGGAPRLEALLVLGESALKAGKPLEADRAYRAALVDAPAGSTERYRALAGVALVAETRKEPAIAKRAYQDIVDGAQDAELVRWARERVRRLEAEERQRSAPKSKTRPQPAPSKQGSPRS